MLIFGLFLLILSIAVTLRRDLTILYSRLTMVIFLYYIIISTIGVFMIFLYIKIGLNEGLYNSIYNTFFQVGFKEIFYRLCKDKEFISNIIESITSIFSLSFLYLYTIGSAEGTDNKGSDRNTTYMMTKGESEDNSLSESSDSSEIIETNTVNSDDDEETVQKKLQLQELDKKLKQEKLDQDLYEKEHKETFEKFSLKEIQEYVRGEKKDKNSDTDSEIVETNTVNSDDDEETVQKKLRLQELDLRLKQEKLDQDLAEKEQEEEKNSKKYNLDDMRREIEKLEQDLILQDYNSKSQEMERKRPRKQTDSDIVDSLQKKNRR